MALLEEGQHGDGETMGGRGVNGAPGREIRSKDEHFDR